MGFRFRKTIKLLPGLKLNVSKGGISTSIGRRGATINIGKKGVRGTIGLPGTGLSYSTMLASRKNKKQRYRAMPAIAPSAPNASAACKVLSLNTVQGTPVFLDARTGVVKITVQGRAGVQNSIFKGIQHTPRGCEVTTDSGPSFLVSSQDGKAIETFVSQLHLGPKAPKSKFVMIVAACVLFAVLLVIMLSNHT